MDWYQIKRSLGQASLPKVGIKVMQYGIMRTDVWMRSLRNSRDAGGVRPDFLVIGAPKCGTTWLDRMLREFPGIHLPQTRKELHFFDRGFDWTLPRYLSHFDADSISGEVTPDYLVLSAERVKQILRLFPEVKLVVLVRDPLERAWSQVRMELGAEKGRAASDISIHKAEECILSTRCRIRSDYATTLSVWMSLASPENLLCLSYEDVGVRPADLMHSVLDFLGADTDDHSARLKEMESQLALRVFSGETHPMPDELRQSVWEVYASMTRRANQYFSAQNLGLTLTCGGRSL